MPESPLGPLTAIAAFITLLGVTSPVHAERTCHQESPISQICEQRSPGYASGNGTDWSPWYEISSEPPPEGYQLVSAYFNLEGDRPCWGTESSPQISNPSDGDRRKGHPTGAGSWAECYQVTLNERVATWAFRMQGHYDAKGQVVFMPSEWGLQVGKSSSRGTSRGRLVTRYITKAALKALK